MTNEENEMWENIGKFPTQIDKKRWTWEEVENIENNWREIDR